jgi:hypothetical protein
MAQTPTGAPVRFETVGLVRRVPLLAPLIVLAGFGPASVSAVTEPVLSPVTAKFVEAEKATHYTVEVTNTSATPT